MTMKDDIDVNRLSDLWYMMMIDDDYDDRWWLMLMLLTVISSIMLEYMTMKDDIDGNLW